MARVGTDMEADFTKLWEAIGGQKDLVAGEPFSIYHKFDMVKEQVSYTCGVPVSSYPDSLPSGVFTDNMEPMKIYTLRHIGPYIHLGNAWTTMQMMMRNKEFRAVKGIHPFETYANAPGEVDEKELITDINFAVK
jgi:hypothetical protein